MEKRFAAYRIAMGRAGEMPWMTANEVRRIENMPEDADLTMNPGKTSEEKQRWNDGLRGVLKELRQKNIKDPNGIAVEIARYRRQFLNDDTRVVNL